MKIYEFTSSLSRKRALRSLLSLIACSSWLANEWRSAEDFSLSRSISLRMSTTSLSYLPWKRWKRHNCLKGLWQNPSWLVQKQRTFLKLCDLSNKHTLTKNNATKRTIRYYGKKFLSFLLTLVVIKWEMHDLAFPIIILSFKNKTKD